MIGSGFLVFTVMTATVYCQNFDFYNPGGQSFPYSKSKVELNLTIDCISDQLPGISIERLTVTCTPSDDFMDELLAVVREGPYIIGFINTSFTDVPKFVSHATSVEELAFLNGNLRLLKTEFYNLSVLTVLKIHNHRLKVIHPEAFWGLRNLRLLNLSRNWLTWLDGNTFSTLSELIDIDLSFNKLTNVNGMFDLRNIQNIFLNNNNLLRIEDMFSNSTWSVRELDLSNNPLYYIGENSFRRKIIGVRKISLRNASLENIHSKAFERLKELRHLDLSHNKLEFVHSDVFSHNLNHLRLLYLSNNRLHNLQRLFAGTKRLEELHLDGNNLEALEDTLNNFLYLLKLNLNGNRISLLDSINFRNLTALQKLSIQFNELRRIGNKSFSDLASLRELYLSNNFITDLNGSLKNLEKLELLALDANPLRELDNEDFDDLNSLKILMLNSTRLKCIDGLFYQLNGLKHLDVRNSNLETIRNTPNLRSLQVYQLEGNPWKCDCKLKMAVQNLSRLAPNVICSYPENAKDKQLNYTEDIEIIECPSECACVCVENNLDQNVYVNCSGRNLTEIPSILPEDIYVLDLSNNLLTTLTDDLCSPFHNLIELNVEDNLISSVEKCITRNLSRIRIARNKLSRAEFLLDDNSLKEVTLSGNNWICTCDTTKFKLWLVVHKDIVPDISQTVCGYYKEEAHLYSNPIYTLPEQDLCPDKSILVFVILLGVLCFLLFLTCCKILYTRYSLNAKIWLYSKGFTCFKNDDIDNDKRFDAFISYSSYDESFVINFLVPGLEEEEPRFSLCLHYRHFAPGEYIHDNILSAVDCSRRTIIVLSRNFLKSEWCRLEFRAAYLKLLEDKVTRIVIVIYGDLPPFSEIDPVIKVHLESTTYLTWGEKYFWQKLRYSMPKNTVSQNPDVCNYHDLIIT